MSRKSTFLSCIYTCKNPEFLMSNRCNYGVNPRRLNSSKEDLYAVKSWFLVRCGMGTACIKFMLYLNSTKRYLLSLLDGIVNWPVLLVKILLERGIYDGNMCLLCGSCSVAGVVRSFVARTWWPRVVL